jgi:hypothetical protein
VTSWCHGENNVTRQSVEHNNQMAIYPALIVHER